MNLEDAVQTFGVECTELLDTMENALLRLELDPSDADLVNQVFRAAHTIKGSSGLFGFDNIVHFAHHVESMLDRVREGSIAIDRPITALLLECRDHIGALVQAATSNDPTLVDEAAGRALLVRLGELLELPDGATAAPASDADAEPGDPHDRSAGQADEADEDYEADGWETAARAGSPADADAEDEIVDGSAPERNWVIRLGFGREVLRHGMDPLAFLRYLQRLGEIQHVDTCADALPAALDLDPECCYLTFDVFFRTAASRTAIEQVFEFVRDDCELSIEPAHGRPARVAPAYAEPSEREGSDTAPFGVPVPALGRMDADADAEARAEAEAESEADAEPTTDGEPSAARAAGHPRSEPFALAKSEPPPRPEPEPAVERAPAPRVVPAEKADGDAARAGEPRSREGRLIRVDAEKLDQLIDLVGELVIAGAGSRLHAERSGLSALIEQTTSVSRLVEEVRNAALGLRMVQIGATFQRYHRVVRDVSHELGKDIELVIEGAETELDKSIVEQLGDPLLHLVRNSMDHGIESVEARVAAGKNARGRLKLNAYHDSGSVVVEVSDDGGGLRRERILQKAISRGLVSADQTLSDREVYDLIFEPGFSTAETVSNLSGRGVGMDVVRSSVGALRGVIELESQPGQGTTVRIRLPLTLAIIDGFLVRSGPVHYVIPLEMVVECLGFSAADKSSARERGFISVRGVALPVVRLSDSFDLPGDGKREDVVVVKSGAQAAGLVVDELLGELQTVIKPLGKLFSHVRGISGSALLGSGEVALILDVNSLVQNLVRGVAKPAQRRASQAMVEREATIN